MTPVRILNALAAQQRRWLLRLLLVLAVYSVVGFLVAPALLKWQLRKQLPRITHRTASVRQVRINPWVLSLTIRGLSLTEANGDPFASFEEFYANFQLSSLFRGAWTFAEIHLIDPRGAVILQRDGRLNFADLFDAGSAPSTNAPSRNAELPRINVFLLNLTNGFVSIEDQTRHSPFRTEYRPINLTLKDFTTRPGTGTPYTFRAENDTGKSLSWTGDLSLQPAASHGTIEVRNAEPRKYQPYLDDFIRAQITDGRAGLKCDYSFSAGADGVDLVLSNGVAQLTQLKVFDPDAKEIVLSLPNLDLQGLRFDLRKRETAAETLKITSLDLRARLNPDGSINLARLLVPPATNSPAKPTAPPTPPWNLALRDFQLTKGSLAFADESRKIPFQTRLEPIEIACTNLATRANTDAGFAFAITTEASEKVAGNGTASMNPPRGKASLDVTGIELKKYWPYLESLFGGEIASGKIDVRVSLQGALTTNGLAAAASNGVAHLGNLQIKTRANNETVLNIPDLVVEGVQASLREQTARVARIKSGEGALVARRETNGAINLLSLLPGPVKAADATNAPAEPAKAETKPSWSASIDEISFENYAIHFTDKAPATPAIVELDQIALSVTGASTTSPANIGARLGLRINGSARVTADGRLIPAPLSANGQLSVTNLDLRFIQPYLAPFARVDLNNGLFNLASKAKWEGAPTNTGRLEFEGGFSIHDFSLSDSVASREVLRWTNLTVEGLKLTTLPQSLQADSIFWDGLDSRLLVRSNKELNVKTLLVTSANAAANKTTNAPPPAKSPGSPIPFPVALGVFALTNSSVHFVDESIQPAAELEFTEIGGAITGLSSDSKATAEVKVGGLAGGQSPFVVSGQINPLAAEPHLNITLSNRNMQLAPLTPYMEKYAGHPLNKGRLSLALHYEIAAKDLSAENHVQIDQLTLGPRNDSPDATKLPVKLAVALLKDSAGKILLDVPVKGRLDDPQFRVGPIILKVIANLMAKAVASPFKLLGAAVGGGEELSFLEFSPGSAEFGEGETNKIAKLAKALAERSLNLEIEPAVDPQRDRAALALDEVRAELKSVRLRELAAIGKTPVAPETFEIEPAAKQRLLRAAVIEQFGTNLAPALQAMATARTNALAATTAESPRPKMKWYEYLKVPFEKKDSPEAVIRRQAKADAELLKENPTLGGLSAETMESLLASRADVPTARFLELMQARIDAARRAFLEAGIGEDRVLLVAPKPMKEGYRGEARVNLSLN